MLTDVVAILVISVLSAGVAFVVYRTLNDGRFIFKAARYELLNGKDHVFLSGPAGTGKTSLITALQQRQPDIVVLAPTALAANTVGGSTVHSFFKFPPSMLLPRQTMPIAAVKDLVARVHTIVVDEVSMVRVDLMDAMDRALRRYRDQPDTPFGGIRMILVGDLFQLPPVANDDDAETLLQHYTGLRFFNAPAFAKIQPELFDLKRVFRQKDKTFSSVLTKIRHSRQTTTDLDIINGRVVNTYVPGQEEGTITIVFTNAKADTVNTEMLGKLPGDPIQSLTAYTGEATNSRVPCEDKLIFKIGAQIVFINNDPSGRWYNGLIGTITALDGEVVKVTSRYGQKIDVPKVAFIVWDYIDKHGGLERVDSGSAVQYPFKLGWAITAHKAQGQTFDRVHIDITDAKAFADGQMYVALSRCRTLENLTISRRIHSKEINVNKESEGYIATLKRSVT